MSWSSGKDSAFALYQLLRDPSVEVCGLLTTVNATHERVAMHAVRRTLLRTQARALEQSLRGASATHESMHAGGSHTDNPRAGFLGLIEVEIPSPCTNAEYESAMREALAGPIAQGISGVAFGDLFLADIRRYREANNAVLGLGSLFPLWQRSTATLAREMIARGQRAIVTCVDPKQCPVEFVGREFDDTFIDDLPESVDPCGENGEFHTFVWDSPLFAEPIAVERGGIVERDGFVFADLVPGSQT